MLLWLTSIVHGNPNRVRHRCAITYHSHFGDSSRLRRAALLIALRYRLATERDNATDDATREEAARV